MLANDGLLRPLRVETSSKREDGVRLLSPEATFITLDMLRRNPRPDDDGTVPIRTRWPIEWKTGTSWGFRDAWSAGVVGRTCSWSGSAISRDKEIRRSSVSMPPRRCFFALRMR